MSNSGLGFGGFLLGLGVGWYLFKYIDLGFDIFSYLLILMGVGMILSGLLSKGRRQHPISGIYGGIVGGLFLAAFLTQGFGFVFDIANEFDDFSGDYRATETFTENTQVTGDMMALNIDSVNGGIEVVTWTGDAVKFDIEVKARGDSTSDAEDNIVDFDYDLSSEVSAGVQEVSLSFPLSGADWIKYSVNIDVFVPTGLSIDYDLETTNGGITLNDLTAGTISLDTTNGGLILSDIEADLINAHTTNGAIRGTITTPESTFDTTNGAIDITIIETSGQHAFSTTNGAIDLTLPTGSDIGHKVNIDTSIGAVDVNLPNMDYSVDRTRSKIGETNGYSSKTVQIEVSADTTIGGIEVN
jgi:Toastrack DUF4097